MNLEIHISDDYLAQLATLIAERLMETRQESLNAFLSEDPAFEAKPQVKAITYPAPAEPVAEPEPAVVEEVEAKPTPAPSDAATKAAMIAALTEVGKARGRKGVEAILVKAGYAAAKDVEERDYAKVIELTRAAA
jgi:hypothetical protein